MKRVLFVVVMIFTCLSGCSKEDALIEKAMHLRESILVSNGTSFRTVITADYGDALYTFQMDCAEDAQGNVTFTVTEPETISGIAGVISQDHAALTFEDKVLAFPPLSDGQLSPVIAPYIFINSLRSGYLSACGREEDGYCVYIDDSFFENQMQLQIYTDSAFIPIHADIIYRDRRILSVDIRDFLIL